MKVIRSRTEEICGPVITPSSPYQWYSAYFVKLPDNLAPGTVIQVFATFEVTNPYQFNVQCDRYIAAGTSWGATSEPIPLCPVTCSNVTPNEHHLRDTVIAVIDDDLLASLGLTWAYLDANYVSLILCAAATGQTGALNLEHGYGEIIACISSP